MYDVIVVGARCGGAPTSMLLARAGYRVLMVDRATFPSDALSGHYIHQPGVAALKRWGILDRVAASNCPPIRRQSFDAGGERLFGNPPPVDGVAEGYCVRRSVLDKILVDAAVESGVEFRQGFTVTEITQKRGRVVGIAGKSQDEFDVTAASPLVIGADGMNSIVARSVEASYLHYVHSLTCNYYAYFTDLPVIGVELFSRAGLFMVAVPTNDGQTVVSVLWPRSQFEIVRQNVESHFLRALGQAPDLLQRARSARRVSRFYGSASLHNFIRKPFGSGWALVGDAGHHKDPLTAQGMSDAFRDAEYLSQAVDRAFTGKAHINEAMAEYESRRNIATMPSFEHTAELARLAAPNDEFLLLLRSLRGNQEQTDRFFGTVAGTVALRDYFSEENMRRIIKQRSRSPMELHAA